jgi:preprotein translocase subunit SecG
MSIWYILMTILIFFDCIILVTLVLIQLPKKDAGAGVAFGAGATDALFGAGSGNVLTKITKYAAGIFFILALIMAVMAGHRPASGISDLMQKVTRPSETGAPLTAPASSSSTGTAPSATPTPNTGLLQFSNAVPTASTNAPAPAPAAKSGTNK